MVRLKGKRYQSLQLAIQLTADGLYHGCHYTFNGFSVSMGVNDYSYYIIHNSQIINIFSNPTNAAIEFITIARQQQI